MPKQKLMAPGKGIWWPMRQHQTHWSVPSLSHLDTWDPSSSLCTGRIWEPGTAEMPAKAPSVPAPHSLETCPAAGSSVPMLINRIAMFLDMSLFPHWVFPPGGLKLLYREDQGGASTQHLWPGVAKTVNQQQRSSLAHYCKSGSLLQA